MIGDSRDQYATYSKAKLFYIRQVSVVVSLSHYYCNIVLSFSKSIVKELLFSFFASTFYAFEDHYCI